MGSRQAASLCEIDRHLGSRLAGLASVFEIALLLNLRFARETCVPLVDLLLRCFASDSVSFLDCSDQLLGLSVDNIEIVVRQFAPALLPILSSVSICPSVGPSSFCLLLIGLSLSSSYILLETT